MKNAANCVNQCELQDTLIIDVSNAHGGSGSLPEPRPVEGRLLPKREFADFFRASDGSSRSRARPSRSQFDEARGFFPSTAGSWRLVFAPSASRGPNRRGRGRRLSTSGLIPRFLDLNSDEMTP